MSTVPPNPVPTEHIDRLILILRGRRVLLDADLATLYGVDTKTFVRAVKRNLDRFPDDFMFQISEQEFANLRRHIGTSSSWGGRRYRPYAFTEQGVAMLASVLRSARAVQANIEIVRAFVRLREIVQTNADLAHKVADLEKKYDGQFRIVFDALRELMVPEETETRKIGFLPAKAPPGRLARDK